jgi:hypothetical protein
METAADSLSHCESLFISTHVGDVALACAGRLIAEHRQGLKPLVVTVFRRQRSEAIPDPVFRLDVERMSFGLAGAAERDARFRTPGRRIFGQVESHGTEGETLRRMLAELIHRVRAKHVYLPLGMGDVDRRLVHDAGVRVFPAAIGQNVFFYEERPEAFVRGALNVRLGQLGTRLPPAVSMASERGRFVQHLIGVWSFGKLIPGVGGFGGRAGLLLAAARAWRGARNWQPRRAYGLRLQPVLPVLQEPGSGDDNTIMELAEAVERIGLITSARQYHRAARRYVARLAASGARERYWLLLPDLKQDDRITLPGEEALAS